MKRQTPPQDSRWATGSYWLAWLTLAIALLYLIASYGRGLINYRALHNADAAFVRLYYRDVLARGSFAGWELPTNPYFFPDMALFIPLDFIVNNVNLSTILYGIAQLLLTTIGLFLLQRQLFGFELTVGAGPACPGEDARPPDAAFNGGPSERYGTGAVPYRLRLAQSVTLLTMSASVLLLATWEHPFYYLPLMPLHHFGVLLVLPYATLFLLRAVQPGQSVAQWRRATLPLFALTFLTALSDSLFIIQFVLPALIALLLWGKAKHLSWGRFLLLAASLLLAAAAGQWLRQWLVPVSKFLQYVNVLDQIELSQAFTHFVTWALQLAIGDPLLAIFWLSSLLALVGVLVGGIKRWRRGDADAARQVLLVATLVLSSIPIAITAALVSGNFNGEESARYILAALFLPLFTGWPLLLALWLVGDAETTVVPASRRWVGAATTLLALLLLGFMLLTAHFSALASIAIYQDPFMACLERETAQRNLRYGLAEYWQANYASALAQEKLFIASTTSTLSPELWNGNRASYQHPFEFIISNPFAPAAWHIDKEFLREKLGPPVGSFTCESSTIYVYNRATTPQLRHWFAYHPLLAAFEKAGEVAELYGYTLPSPIGGVAVGLSQGASEQWDQDEGTLAYAPLKGLPAGSYAVAFDLFADIANAGAWEVVAITPKGPQLLYGEMITPTDKSMITGHFDLQSESDVDVGVKYNGRGALYVDRIRIVRLEPTQMASFRFAEAATPTAAPQQGQLSLIHPSAGSEIAHREVDFVWQWTGQSLSQAQTFEVRLWRKGESIHYGAHDAMTSRALIRQIGDTRILRLDLNGAYSIMQHGTGEYEWTVALVAIEPTYQDLHIEALPFALGIE